MKCSYSTISLNQKGIQKMTLLYVGWRVALVVLLLSPSSMKSVRFEILKSHLQKILVGNRFWGTHLDSKPLESHGGCDNGCKFDFGWWVDEMHISLCL